MAYVPKREEESKYMARHTGPRNRLARREGADLGLKTVGSKAHATLLKRLNIPPGMKAYRKIKPKTSDYGIQLREKQKAKIIYGILERQFIKYYKRAAKNKGATGFALLQFLERRLDNVLYRLGFTPTRSAARQLVNHGHVIVDGKKVSVPSWEVKEGNVITLKPQTLEIAYVKKSLDNKTNILPKWLSRKGPAGRVDKLPQEEDLTENINEQLIVEYYSR